MKKNLSIRGSLKNASVLVLSALFCCLIFSACGNKNSPYSPTLVAIQIVNEPDKTSYFTGESLDLTGLEVSALYSDGSEAKVTAYTTSGFDSETPGIQTITVSYKGKKANFTIEVEIPPLPVSSIKIATPPNKTTYSIGEPLDLTGLEVKATFSDGSEEEITAYTTSGYDSETPGIQKITVSYMGKDTEFTVEVESSPSPVTVSSIKIATPPNKTTYSIGEPLDLTGLEVKATFSDGSEEEITAYTTSGYDSETPGIQKITVSYMGKDTEFTVEVIAISESLIEMVQIPAGTFLMGSPNSEAGRAIDGREGPQRTVELSGFYMSKYPVTQAEYQVVTGENPSDFTPENNRLPFPGEIGENRPVEQVNWYEAIVFCNRLSIKENRNPAYSISDSTDPDMWGTVPDDTESPDSAWNKVKIVAGSNGYRLPTEAQWEYACRAGTTTLYSIPAPDGSTGLTSISAPELGWHGGNSDMGTGPSNRATHEVGLKPANAWELHDMYGNVEEWCWDRYDQNYYTGRPVPDSDPEGPESDSIVYRIRRGGSWVSTPHIPGSFPPPSGTNLLRSAARNWTDPWLRQNYIGMRLVLPDLEHQEPVGHTIYGDAPNW